MIKIILNGCNGKMGQVITRIAQTDPEIEIAAGFDVNDNIENKYPVFTNPSDCDTEADVLIDFSHPSALGTVISYCRSRKLPCVIATTGLSAEQRQLMANASFDIPIFFSSNMSLGINLLISLCRKAIPVIEGSYDIEIIEKHHNQKIDAPSGTALSIADAINDTLKEKAEYVYDRHSVRKKRSKTEIGLHSVRGGTIVGEHDVIFAGLDEVIELKHSAQSREVFAVGAVKAAKFMVGKSAGMYNMDDLFE